MESHFASPERATQQEIQREIECVEANPVIDGLMNLVSGLLAVLNEHRQIVALNTGFLSMLGIDDPGEVLGLRLGESLKCVHADDMPAGCGTSEFCSSCGAAIAIVASLGSNKAEERECAVAVERNGIPDDLYLKVKALPLTIEDSRFIMLFMQDITRQQQWATLEKVFFHDINNLMHALIGNCELHLQDHGESDTARKIHDLALRLSREVEIQRSLFQSGLTDYHPAMQDVSINAVIGELQQVFANHSIAQHRTIVYPVADATLHLKTDRSLLLRILENMVLNALEATPEGGQVEVACTQDDHRITFRVWNARVIPAAIRKRIFQRNITTKNGLGRGVGLYSMKLFGENVLGGTVSFTTDEESGTTFSLVLPLS